MKNIMEVIMAQKKSIFIGLKANHLALFLREIPSFL